MRLYRKSDLIRLSHVQAQSRESLLSSPGTPISGRVRSNTVLSTSKSENAFLAGGDGTEHVFLVYLSVSLKYVCITYSLKYYFVLV